MAGDRGGFRVSRDRYLAVGKDQIGKNPLLTAKDKEDKIAKFAKRVRKFFGDGLGGLIIQGSDKCLVCGAKLRGAPGQVVIYCSKPCRRKRHNAKR